MQKTMLYQPESIGIEICGVCNFKCKYCVLAKRENKTIMPLSAVKNIIAQIRMLPYSQNINLYLNVLGEPMIHPDFFDILFYIKQQRLKLNLVTNGSLMTKNNLLKIQSAPPDFINISLETINKAVFSSFRGTTMAYETYLEGIINTINLFYSSLKNSRLSFSLMFVSKYILKLLFHSNKGVEYFWETYRSKKQFQNDLFIFLKKLN